MSINRIRRSEVSFKNKGFTSLNYKSWETAGNAISFPEGGKKTLQKRFNGIMLQYNFIISDWMCIIILSKITL